jgi:omega-amidase
VKLAAAQIACALGEVTANVRKMRHFALRAKEAGAELVVFPEMSDTGYVMEVIRDKASRWDEGAVPQLRQIAQELSIAIISGLSEKEGTAIYNSQIAIDPRGEIIGKYRKTHLFAPIGEDQVCARGDCLTSLAFGPFRFGLTICYDLRFPELYRALALEQQVNVFINSSAWPFPRLEHLRILAAARAIENQSYLILANRVGRDSGAPFCGSSAIIDPSGVIIAAAGPDREGLVVADLSSEGVAAVREKTAVFAHRRADLYR